MKRGDAARTENGSTEREMPSVPVRISKGVDEADDLLISKSRAYN